MVAATTAPKANAPAASKIVGIIYPPPEIRNIIDKTAQYVAKNGATFLERIRENEASNPKFSFLKQGDPYNAYFEMRVSEGYQPDDRPPGTEAPAPAPVAAQQARPEPVQPIEPPPDFEFSLTVPTISAQDIDIVKLTAQFVARNGRQFLTSLMQREARNYHFDFLRPQHSLFNYFTKLVEHYTKVLIPPKGVKEELKRAADDPFVPFEHVQRRVQWAQIERERKKKEDDLLEKERMAFQQIDWHDFVIVETVPFPEDEMADLPPPVDVRTLLARVLEQERFEVMRREGKLPQREVDAEEEALMAEAAAAEMASEESEEEKEEEKEPEEVEDVEMDVEMDMESPEPNREEEEEEEKEKEPEPAPAPLLPENVVIRKDYNPKERKRDTGAGLYQTCPNCGQSILASELDDHIRIELLDPRWREQKERLARERAQGQEVYASANAMEQTLKHIAEYRTDIFGADDREFSQKVAEDKKKLEDRVVWDGHTSSMAATAKKAQEKINPADLKPTPTPDTIGPRITQIQPPPPAQPRPPVMQQPPPPPFGGPMGARPGMMGVGQPGMAPPFAAPGIMGIAPGAPMPGMGPMGGMSGGPAPPPPFGMPAPPATTGPAPPMAGMMPGMGGMGMGSIGGVGPMGAIPTQASFAPEEEHAAKRLKLDTGSQLVPEDQWAATHPGPVLVTVSVPESAENPQWNMVGQNLTLTLDIRSPVSKIKDYVHDTLGMPHAKQKLQIGALFAKDAETLAYHNVGPGTIVHLSVKERGGRKK